LAENGHTEDLRPLAQSEHRAVSIQGPRSSRPKRGGFAGVPGGPRQVLPSFRGLVLVQEKVPTMELECDPLCAAPVQGFGRAQALLASGYGAVFGPEDIPKLVTAYEAALRKLGLVDRNDHLALTLAKLIIGLAKDGERDPDKLSDRAARILRK
jgi:hypothetical protein